MKDRVYLRYRKRFCEKCGSSLQISIHHKNRNHKDNDEQNLQTLCWKCHKQEHRFGVRKYMKIIKVNTRKSKNNKRKELDIMAKEIFDSWKMGLLTKSV
jgi:5-methylcytosine-specific restriction endonuclease McrA